MVIVLQKIGTSAGKAAHFNVKFRHCRDLATSAVDFSAHFDDAVGWSVGEWLPQEMLIDGGSKREEAVSMLVSGQSWETVAEQTRLSRATIFRLKKELSK